MPALDGWIYNAKSNRRFRLAGDASEPAIDIEKTVNRGQWGIAQDDQGRLYYNHNSSFIFADAFPGEYALRQPATHALKDKPGLGVDLADGQSVWGIRTAAGLNRADEPGVLRPDGRQNGPEAVSSLEIQRGDQFGADYIGDAFVPESGGSVVAHFSIDFMGVTPRAKHKLYEDPDWVKREFLASTDERFRPVDAKVGPDGALWIIDMYRGVIQHKAYMSEHLREHVRKLGFEAPGETGRIWRIVRTENPIDYQATLNDQLSGLDHPNGWVRDRAQRRIAHEKPIAAVSALRQLKQFSAKGRLHALWSLHALDALDLNTLRVALTDAEPSIRRHALHLAATLLPDGAQEIKQAAAVVAVLDRAHALGDSVPGRAMVKGIADSQYLTGNIRVVLDKAHELFKQSPDSEFGKSIAMARTGFTWEGDATPVGVRHLTDAETALREHGRALYATTCASCHGDDGRGIRGLAPPLAGSNWARDADEWLVGIALHGVSGPITVLGEEWNSSMPGFADDPRFDDESLAGLATHIRRSWGHADSPVSPMIVARIREQTQARPTSWTEDELLALTVNHRLDKYIGNYQIPIVDVELQISRNASRLMLGLSIGGKGPLTELSYGVFSGGGVTIEFDSDDGGVTGKAKVTYLGQSFSVERVENS